jgi:type I restriction enzyme S subunit
VTVTLDLLFPHLDELIQTPADVQRLNEAILQLAVQGKLVPQDPHDEPAGELLKRILAENDTKASLLPPIALDETPFTLPSSWEWVRLGTIIHISSGDGLTSVQMAQDGHIPVYGGNGITGYHNHANVLEPTIVIGRVGYHCGSVHLTEGAAWVTDNAFVTRYLID